MKIISTTNVHHVTSIRLERVLFSDFVSHRFILTNADGHEVHIDAFADAVIPIDLGERSAMGEPA